MTASEELANLFKSVSEEVDSWESWKRSLDPQGSENDRIDSRKADSDDGWTLCEPKVDS